MENTLLRNFHISLSVIQKFLTYSIISRHHYAQHKIWPTTVDAAWSACLCVCPLYTTMSSTVAM